jgi:LacI family transcriptional regulator
MTLLQEQPDKHAGGDSSMAIRMKDIARDLDVSVVTVSKVLRGHTDIGPETRERVLRRVKELNYRPNLAARSLVTGRTYMVGLVVPDLLHPFFAQIAEGVGRRIRPKGYNVVLFSSNEDAELETEGIESLLAHQVDGLVVASTLAPAQSEISRRIDQQNVPYVLVDREIPGLEGNFVGTDEEQIGVLATEHLIQRGNRRIAHIRGPELSTASGRLTGYTNTMRRFGLPVRSDYIAKVASADVCAEECGFRAMQQLLAVDPRPDAVFCYNDLVAVGALRASLEAGVSVPDDIAFVGAANMPYSDFLRVPLSTIDQGSLDLGDRAAKLLLRCMQPNKRFRPTRIYLPPKLIVRDSSAVRPSTEDQSVQAEPLHVN